MSNPLQGVSPFWPLPSQFTQIHFPTILLKDKVICNMKNEWAFYLWFDDLSFTLMWHSWLTGHQIFKKIFLKKINGNISNVCERVNLKAYSRCCSTGDSTECWPCLSWTSLLFQLEIVLNVDPVCRGHRCCPAGDRTECWPCVLRASVSVVFVWMTKTVFL